MFKNYIDEKKTNNHLLNVKNVSFGYIHIVLSLRLRIRTMYYYIVSMHRDVLFMVKSHEVYTWPLTLRIVNTLSYKTLVFLVNKKIYTICMHDIQFSISENNMSILFFNHIKIYIKYIWALILRKSSKKEVEEKQHQHNMCNTC